MRWLGFAGSGVLWIALLVTGLALALRFSWLQFADAIGERLDRLRVSRQTRLRLGRHSQPLFDITELGQLRFHRLQARRLIRTRRRSARWPRLLGLLQSRQPLHQFRRIGRTRNRRIGIHPAQLRQQLRRPKQRHHRAGDARGQMREQCPEPATRGSCRRNSRTGSCLGRSGRPRLHPARVLCGRRILYIQGFGVPWLSSALILCRARARCRTSRACRCRVTRHPGSQ